MLIRIEGDVLHHHSLARINCQLAQQLVRKGHQVQIEQRSQFDQLSRRDVPEVDEFFTPGTPDVTFRHGYPPDFSEGENIVYQQFWEFGSYPNEWKYQWADKASHLICGSSYLYKMAQADGIPVPFSMIHPGIDPVFFEQKERKDGPLRFLFVGGSTRRKGIDILLDAISKAGVDAEFIIKDHPFYASDISERVFGLENVTYLRQYMRPAELVDLYASADIFILPSRGEGLGLPVLEAMAQGLTIMVPDHTGLSDFIQPDTLVIPATKTDYSLQMNTVRDAFAYEPDLDSLVELIRKAEPPTDRQRYQHLIPHWEEQAEKYIEVFSNLTEFERSPIAQVLTATPEEAVKLDPGNKEFQLAYANSILQKEPMKGFEIFEKQATTPQERANFMISKGQYLIQRGQKTSTKRDIVEGADLIFKAAELDPYFPIGNYLPKLPNFIRNTYKDLLNNRTKVSGVMIAKNEEDNIERALRSVRPYVDEMIVVDTGSTDRTIEIAQKYARVESRPDFFSPELGTLRSFAEARNYSISLATGDYIFWLDADDEISPEVGQMIRQIAVDDRGSCSFPVICPHLNADGTMTETEVRHLRLFKNLPEVRFEGSIHEQIAPAALAAGLEIVASGAQIRHHGYTEESTLQKKYERNLKMLLASDDGSDFAGFNLMTSYHLLGRTQEAAEIGEARLPQLSMDQAMTGKYLSTLSGIYSILEDFTSALRIIELGIKSGANLPEHYHNQGSIWSTLYNKTKNEEYLDRAVESYKKAITVPSHCRGGAIDLESTNIRPLSQLANVLVEQKKYFEAIDTLLLAISFRPDTHLVQNLVYCYETVGDFTAAARIKGPPVEADEAYFESILKQDPDDAVANLNYGAYLADKDPDRALVYLSKSLATKPTIQVLYSISRALRYQGQPLLALAPCDVALEATPTSGLLHYEMALIAEQLGKPTLAIKCLQFAQACHYDDPETLLVATRAHNALGSKSATLEMLRRANDVIEVEDEELWRTIIWDQLEEGSSP